MRIVKWLELGIMLLGAWGFAEKSFPDNLLVCTLLMGTHSTVFGPAKYAYLPQHPRVVGKSSPATVWSKWEPSVAISAGHACSAAAPDRHRRAWASLPARPTCVALACAGVLTSQGHSVDAAAPTRG